VCASLAQTYPQAQPFAPLATRILGFRAASEARAVAARSPRQANMDIAFFDLYARRPFWERYVRALAYALEHEPVYLFSDERLVGMLYQTSPAPSPEGPGSERWQPYDAGEQMRRRQEREIDPYMTCRGAPGHIGWRWERVLAEGVSGIVAELRTRLRQSPDAEARRFYRGALILWRAALRWNDAHVTALVREAERASGAEHERLLQLAQVCRRVPRYPARTFREAVQACHMQHLIVLFENPCGGNGPGRMDQFLWPYLERDLAAGRTTLAEAKELIDELFIRYHERLYHADLWVETVMLGGTRADGSTAANPLSTLMIESAGALDQTHPAVYVRLGQGSSAELVDATVRYLLYGHNRAQVFNDDACLPALVRAGVPYEDAVDYMAGGCMEISVQGMSCDLNFAGTLNVAKTLEQVLTGGVDLRDGQKRLDLPGDLTSYTRFAQLYDALAAELEREYGEMTRALDIASVCYARYRPCYLLSTLIGDCLVRGREQQAGGARYHDYGFAPLGVTAAADSLRCIEQAVYGPERFTTAEELLAALRANYQGFGALQARLRRIPRFGVEDAAADALTNRVLHTVCELATHQRNRHGGTLKPMVFNFVWTPGASRELGARADGSPAGERIGHGVTPHSSAMTRGLSAALNSSTALDLSCVAGGATTMWDLDEKWASPEVVRAVLNTFLARGGMIFQGNMTSVRELEAALAQPERYPNLIVRVGGFSARFVTLERAVQEEIITRRRHNG
jgi:trans-4-hydroxy-L-proline dehydratase